MYTHAEVTERIIAAFYSVYNTLGYGFLEKVYQNAMEVELPTRGLNIVPQAPLKVYYSGVVVGEYFADILVEGQVILELKAVERLIDIHGTQLVNYLKASGIEIGLVLNFGPKPQLRRKVFDHTHPTTFHDSSAPDELSGTSDPADEFFH